MRALLPLALLALASLPTHADPTDITVTLSVHASVTFPYDEPAFETTCSVTVPAGSKAAAVLDQAEEDGCIDDWSGIDYGGSLGRYLTGIEDAGASESTDAMNADDIRFLCGAFTLAPGGALFYSFWGFSLNDASASLGIDSQAVAHGDEVQFFYVVDTCPSALYLAYLEAGVWPQSPEPVEGNAVTDFVGGF